VKRRCLGQTGLLLSESGIGGMALAFGHSVLCVLLLAASGQALARGADGDFEKRSSSHFVLYQDVDIDETSGLRGSRRFEQQVLATLERAYDELDALLGLRPRPPLSVTVYDPGIFDQRFAGLFRFPAAGFYGQAIHVRGDVRLRVGLVRTLHHELVHAALDQRAPSLAIPAWWNEGIAEWFEARATGKRLLTPAERDALARASRAGQLLSLSELSSRSFGGLQQRSASFAYLQSYAFFEFLSRSYGERSLRDLVERYLRTGDLDSAFRRTYRADLDKLQIRFEADLQR